MKEKGDHPAQSVETEPESLAVLRNGFLPDSYKKCGALLHSVNDFDKRQSKYSAPRPRRKGEGYTDEKHMVAEYEDMLKVIGQGSPHADAIRMAYNFCRTLRAMQSHYLYNEYNPPMNIANSARIKKPHSWKNRDNVSVEEKPESYDRKHHEYRIRLEDIKNPRAVVDMVLTSDEELNVYNQWQSGAGSVYSRPITEEYVEALERFEEHMLAAKKAVGSAHTQHGIPVEEIIERELTAYRESGLQSASKGVRELYFSDKSVQLR